MKYKLDVSLLYPLQLFNGLPETAVRHILDKAETRRIAPNQTVFIEGHEAVHFYLVLDGIIRIVRTTKAGDQVTAIHIPPGQLFGNARAVQHDQYPASAITASEAVVLYWPSPQWDAFASAYPPFAKAHYKIMGQRINELTSRVVDAETARVDERVARALMRLMHQSGRKTDGGIEIGFPITRRDVSELTGTTSHTVSRLLSAWERDDIVQSRRKKIVIRNPDKLSEACGA